MGDSLVPVGIWRMMDLFEGSEVLHGTHGEPELDENGVKWNIKKTARTLRGPATLELWQKAEKALGGASDHTEIARYVNTQK